MTVSRYCTDDGIDLPFRAIGYALGECLRLRLVNFTLARQMFLLPGGLPRCGAGVIANQLDDIALDRVILACRFTIVEKSISGLEATMRNEAEITSAETGMYCHWRYCWRRLCSVYRKA